MKYSKIVKSALFGGLFCLMICSCTDWLSVNDEDLQTEDTAFSSERNIQKVLNGIYLSMADEKTYGRNMTCFTTELLAQTYNINSNTGSTSLALRWYLTQYTFTNEDVRSHILNLWRAQYNSILQINKFIERMDALKDGIVYQSYRDLMLGEAYALRAFIHLDMLRMFGPIPTAANKTANSIPYYTKSDVEWQPIESHEVIIGKILDDIDHAIFLLRKDPVRTEGVRVGKDYEGDFWAHRNRRMNYYAVNALKVRALMWDGRKAEASVIAKRLINDTKFANEFRWVTDEDVTSPLTPDRIASNEVLFGIHNQDMYKNWETYFSPNITHSNSLMAASEGNIKSIYGTDWTTSPDYRVKNWSVYSTAPSYIVQNKFKMQGTEEGSLRFFQPLIRKAELYYVIAEADADPSYLDQVRLNRGLKTFGSEGINSPVIADQIVWEFMREMYGEGQLFFHYKRLGKSSIYKMDGTSTATASTQKAMTASEYVIPIPDSEKNR